MEQEVSVYEAKAKLSEILRRVRNGKQVTITYRGQKVARVIPYREEAAETFEERTKRLIAAGLIKPAKRSPAEALKRFKPFLPRGALQRFLRDRD